MISPAFLWPRPVDLGMTSDVPICSESTRRKDARGDSIAIQGR